MGKWRTMVTLSSTERGTDEKEESEEEDDGMVTLVVTIDEELLRMIDSSDTRCFISQRETGDDDGNTASDTSSQIRSQIPAPVDEDEMLRRASVMSMEEQLGVEKGEESE